MSDAIKIIQREHRAVAAVIHAFDHVLDEVRDKKLAPDFELFEAILEWWPEELIEMEGLPEKFVTSKAYRDLEATRDMRKLAKQRRAEKEAKRVNDITEDSTSDNYDFGEVPETPPQPNFADEEVE